MLVLAVQTASRIPEVRMVASPLALNILMSSPNVKNGTNPRISINAMARHISRRNSGWRVASIVVERAMMPVRVK